MISILSDHNMDGEAAHLQVSFDSEGWQEHAAARYLTYADVELNREIDDRSIWRFARSRQMLLLTDDRYRRGANSLEATIREERTAFTLMSHLELFRLIDRQSFPLY